MILYHRTTSYSALSILRAGFRDGAGRYLTDMDHMGVWVSDRPLNDDAGGDALLKITFHGTEQDLTGYEWIQEGKIYREWLVPAQLLNEQAGVEIIQIAST